MAALGGPCPSAAVTASVKASSPTWLSPSWNLLSAPSSLFLQAYPQHTHTHTVTSSRTLHFPLEFHLYLSVYDFPFPFIPILQISMLLPHGLFSSVQFSSVAQSCPNLCDPINRSTPGLPVHHHLPDLTQTHVHRVSDAIQPSHPGSPLSPPAPTLSQHQSLFQ